MTKVAVLGLGIIGSRVADRLVAAGFSVKTWSRRTRGRADEADSAEAAADGAEVISLFLKDGWAVREVMAGVSGMLHPGQVVLNHSTVDLETTKWLEGLCGERGCGFLDAPFTGSKLAAEKGELIYYVSGDGDLAERMDGFLGHSSRMRMRCGGVGHATVIKLATNLISACTVQALAEALGLVTRMGIAAEDLIRAVEVNAHASPLAMMKLPAMAKEEFEPHFSLGNMKKDGLYACGMAGDMDLELPAIDAVTRRMEWLCERGWADLDYSVLGKPYLERP